MKTFDSNEYDDELDQGLCAEYFPKKIDLSCFFNTDSECRDLLAALEIYRESNYFLYDFENAPFIKQMSDFFVYSWNYQSTIHHLEDFFRKAAIGSYYLQIVEKDIDGVDVDAAFKFAFPLLAKVHCQVLVGQCIYFSLISPVIKGLQIFADLREKNIALEVWDSPSLFSEDILPDSVLYMVHFFDRLQKTNEGYKRYQLENFLKIIAAAPVGIGTQQVIEEFDLPRPSVMGILSMAEKVSATTQTSPIDSVVLSEKDAVYEKTGLPFCWYVTQREQEDALKLNLATLRKYNADHPYEVHEFSFSSNADFYTEILERIADPDELLWTKPEDLIQRTEDAVFAAAYGSQPEWMSIYYFEPKTSLQRKTLLDAAPLVAAIHIAQAYGKCPSYRIFKGISEIIDSFGVDSSYVLQRTCQYVLDLGYPLIYENLDLARPIFNRIVDVAAEKHRLILA